MVRWYVDGELRAEKKTWDDKVSVDAPGDGHDKLLVRYSGLGKPRRATLFATDEDVAALTGLGGVDLVPAPGSAAERYEDRIREHPTRYAAIATAGGVAKVVVPILIGLVVVRFAVSLPFPHVPTPDLPDLPSVPWPSIPLPDLPDLPEWQLPGLAGLAAGQGQVRLAGRARLRPGAGRDQATARAGRAAPSHRAGLTRSRAGCHADRVKELNVLGDELEPCGTDPMTGFFRDGCCHTGPEDRGSHTICAVVTAEFLDHQRGIGNDLSSPMPQFGFPGLVPGDRWCVTALNWARAYRDGAAAPVVLGLDQRRGAQRRSDRAAPRVRGRRTRRPELTRALSRRGRAPSRPAWRCTPSRPGRGSPRRSGC